MPAVASQDLSDPLQVAVKVTAVEGTLALLSQQVSQGLGNVQSQLSALQAEQRENSKQISDLAVAMHALQAQSSGMERLALAIEQAAAENSAWRRNHESENRGVADAVTGARAALKFVAWIGAFIVGLIVATVQIQFDGTARDRMRLEQAHRDDVQRLERRMDRADAEREELKKMRGLK